MIDAEVKSMDWSDEYSEDSEIPAMLAMTATIGEKGKEGGHNFQVIACNPAWISSRINEDAGIWPRGILIVESINPEHVRRTLQNLADQFRGSKSWSQFAERMNRYLLWEFEDYNDFQSTPIVPSITDG